MENRNKVTQYKIMLKPEEIQRFIQEADRCDFDVDISADSHVVDAKSILGICGLDLSRVLTVRCHGYDPDFEECLKKYAAEERVK